MGAHEFPVPCGGACSHPDFGFSSSLLLYSSCVPWSPDPASVVRMCLFLRLNQPKTTRDHGGLTRSDLLAGCREGGHCGASAAKREEGCLP